jgi:hypothetical protein
MLIIDILQFYFPGKHLVLPSRTHLSVDVFISNYIVRWETPTTHAHSPL